MSKTALEIQHLHAWCNQECYIEDFSLCAQQGEVVMLLYSCSKAQCCLLHSLLGLNPHRKGSVRIHQSEAIHLTADTIPELGLAHCSIDTGLVPQLSCEDNLLLPLNEQSLGGGLPLGEIYQLFPSFSQQKDYACSSLHRNELQLLALARVLRTGADILVINNLYNNQPPDSHHAINQLLKKLQQRGYTIILNEQQALFQPVQQADQTLFVAQA